MPASQANAKTLLHHLSTFLWLTIGAFLAAVAIRIFLVPNQLIDGGVVGIALILAAIWR
jgi:uncharacterized membrane-anchored protein YitT (DUF2179 family)